MWQPKIFLQFNLTVSAESKLKNLHLIFHSTFEIVQENGTLLPYSWKWLIPTPNLAVK